MAIVVPVTPHAVLRGAVRPAVVPGLVLFAAIAPFIGVAPAVALQEDQAHLDHCPAAQQDAVLASLRSAVELVKEAVDQIQFAVKRPMSDALITKTIRSFSARVRRWGQVLQSETERSLLQSEALYSEKVRRALMDTGLAQGPESVDTRVRWGTHARATLTVAFLAPTKTATKRRRDDDCGTVQHRDLILDIHSKSGFSHEGDTNVRLRAQSMEAVQLDASAVQHPAPDEVAAVAAYFHGTRFEQLLSPEGTVALVRAIVQTLSGKTRGE